MRREYWQTVQNVQEEDFVFIDEAGVNLALVRLYARALKGRRARGVRPQKPGKNVSMIGAVALRGVIASANIYGAGGSITFEAFIINKLVPQLWQGACVVLDNSTIHKGEEIQAAIEAAGAKARFLISLFSRIQSSMKICGTCAQNYSSSYWSKNLSGFGQSARNCLCSNFFGQHS